MLVWVYLAPAVGELSWAHSIYFQVQCQITQQSVGFSSGSKHSTYFSINLNDKSFLEDMKNLPNMSSTWNFCFLVKSLLIYILPLLFFEGWDSIYKYYIFFYSLYMWAFLFSSHPLGRLSSKKFNHYPDYLGYKLFSVNCLSKGV